MSSPPPVPLSFFFFRWSPLVLYPVYTSQQQQQPSTPLAQVNSATLSQAWESSLLAAPLPRVSPPSLPASRQFTSAWQKVATSVATITTISPAQDPTPSSTTSSHRRRRASGDDSASAWVSSPSQQIVSRRRSTRLSTPGIATFLLPTTKARCFLHGLTAGCPLRRRIGLRSMTWRRHLRGS